jgi:pimeloyl-ACP methyl ester carboxylesterase
MVMEPKHVDANGTRFAYLEEGTGPLVLMIHGFPDTPQTWDVARPAVAAAGLRVVTPFQRGYAPSAIPADGKYDGETLGRDVLALIEALGAKTAILVGHDWGAGAVYSAATIDPTRVTKLIAIGVPHPASIRPSLRLLWHVRHFFTLPRKGAAAKVRANDFAHVDELVQRWSPKWNVPRDETRAVKRAFSEPGSLEAALAYYRDNKLGRRPSSQRAKIAVPTIAFGGTDDILPIEAYDRAASWFPNGYEVVRMPGGHFMHREYPEVFVRELLRVIGAPAV